MEELYQMLLPRVDRLHAAILEISPVTPLLLNFWDRETAADLLHQLVGDFDVSGDSFDCACQRIDPKRMAATFAFEVTAMPA